MVAEARDHLDIVVTEPCDGPDFLVTEPCDDPDVIGTETDASNRAGRRPAWTRMRMSCRRKVPIARPHVCRDGGATDLTRLVGYNGATASSRPLTPWPDLPRPWRNLTGRRQDLTENCRNPTETDPKSEVSDRANAG